MCDELTEQDNARLLNGDLSRRQFNTLTVGAAVAMMLPAVANAMDVVEQDVQVETEDGVADCYFVHPASGVHPGVIVWPDILGLRPAFRQMGKRLAESGYSVLVINPYYRNAPSPVVQVGDSFADPDVRAHVLPFARALSGETTATDTRAFVEFLDAQGAVDTRRGIGTTGYCMGGPMVMQAAATAPERIHAAATFHGGGLATGEPTSPHLLIPEMEASFLIAVAANDDERDPEAKVTLRQAFDAAGLSAEIEVYEGAMHGWCPPDSRVYNEAQAERAWSRLLVLFETALA